VVQASSLLPGICQLSEGRLKACTTRHCQPAEGRLEACTTREFDMSFRRLPGGAAFRSCKPLGFALAVLGLLLPMSAVAQTSWEAEVFPAEHEITTVPETGARLIYVTNAPTVDTNLYFHRRSWLPDSSLLLFRSARSGRSELFGYIEATGELVRVQQPEHRLQGDASASKFGNKVFVIHGATVYAWHIAISPGAPSTVTVREERIGAAPGETGALLGMNENSDGSMVFFGRRSEEGGSEIYWMETATGAIRKTMPVDARIQHIQASWDQPGLLMYTRGEGDRAWQKPDGSLAHRMWLADLSDRESWVLYPQLEGELVTHEAFWVDNQVVFCTGIERENNAEESHVKVVNVETGVARITGAGAWWPGGSPEEVAKLNWWHCAGAPNGRFVAADNWHGDIAIFSGKTARTRILSTGHREYGQGAHPHVGWDPAGHRVVFATNMRGQEDVCIAELPEAWLSEDW